MQKLADISPMAWGVEGFLDLFLRGGGIAAVLPESLQLLLLGSFLLTTAGLNFRSSGSGSERRDHDERFS